jgi:hypothetical protein
VSYVIDLPWYCVVVWQGGVVVVEGAGVAERVGNGGFGIRVLACTSPPKLLVNLRPMTPQVICRILYWFGPRCRFSIGIFS